MDIIAFLKNTIYCWIHARIFPIFFYLRITDVILMQIEDFKANFTMFSMIFARLI